MIPQSIVKHEQNGSAWTFSSGWATLRHTATSGGSGAYSNSVGATASVGFDGPGEIRLLGAKRSNYGIAQVSLDGGPWVDVDMYSTAGSYQALVYTNEVSTGAHTLTVRVSGDKNPSATATWVFVDCLQIVRESERVGEFDTPSCEACHADADHEAPHQNSGLDANCTSCHRDSLTEEHLRNAETQTQALSCGTCHASSRGDIVWAIFSGDKRCSACHLAAHNFALVAPDPGLPKYPGYTWTVPLDAMLWAGEPWMPDELTDGKVLLSNRRLDVTGPEVYAFYAQEMAVRGWTLETSEPSDWAVFSMRFTSGSHTVLVWFRGTEGHSPGPIVRTGYMVEMVYD